MGYTSSGAESTRGCSRWMVYAGFGGLLLMVGFLLSSLFVLERGVDLVLLRARQRILQNLPEDLGAAERRRTERNLQRFFRDLSHREDQTPLIGEFIDRVSKALNDDVLTVAEVEELNQFLVALSVRPGDLVGQPRSARAARTSTPTTTPTATPDISRVPAAGGGG